MVNIPIPEMCQRLLRRRGFGLDFMTLGWTVIGVVLLAVLASSTSSVALVGFGLESLIEIGASTVVLCKLSGTGQLRHCDSVQLIGAAFVALAAYPQIQSTVTLVAGDHASPSVGGIVWTRITRLVMYGLAAGESKTGNALENLALVTEGRVTFVDALLAVAVLLG